MSLHINRFLDRVRVAESKQQRHVTLTVSEARDLHTDITKLLLKLDEFQQQKKPDSQDSITSISIDGGSF
jgi:hypothetical protein